MLPLKNRLMAFLLVCVMALSFAVPTMATIETVAVEPKYVSAEQEIVPFTEFTQIFWRTYNGQLQFRVWSLTFGRWNTDWTNLNLL